MKGINKKIALVVSMAPWSAGALSVGSVVTDNTLPGHPSNTIIPLMGGTYTIPASLGYVNSPGGTAHNLFSSFQTFNIDTGETGLITNDLTGTYASRSFYNITSRVTGGTPTTINGTVDSTASPNANFWFVNPAGITMRSGATIKVPAGIALGSADYFPSANGDYWHVLVGNGTVANPSVLVNSAPASSGSLPNTAAGARCLSGVSIDAPPGPTSSIVLSAGSAGISVSH
jgi:filamentous hemagglutinin family protein